LSHSASQSFLSREEKRLKNSLIVKSVKKNQDKNKKIDMVME
jgi:hypothetical protein